MTQEEKAKAYDNALEIAKGLYAKDAPDSLHLERMFPELKESEDEKIRKAIHIYFDWLDGRKDYQPKGEYTIRDMIAWLEKQGAQKQDPCDNCKDVMLNCHNFPCIKKRAFKQGKSVLEAIIDEKVDNANKVEPKDYSSIDPHFGKPVDKVKPKSKQGQWIVWKDKCYKVNYNGCGYELIDQNGLSTSLEYGTVDTSARLWDVTKDAKAGDVLVIQETDFTYESIFIFNKIENNHIIQYLHYFITDTDEEVCKVKSVGGFIGDVGDNVHPATKEQREQLKKAMTDAGYAFNFDKKELKKIEVEPAWSYEDEANLNNIIWLCNNCIKGSETTWIPSQATKIKHLIETIKEKGLVQQNPAWSEEDKKTLERVIRCIENHDYMNVDDIQWLKSLKDRCTWRPSDEQMKALEHFVRSVGESGYASPYENNTKLLYSLLEQLKKLKGGIEL